MKKIIDLISDELKKAFAKGGYDEVYGQATVSNRPDLCEYQCNGAMSAAKAYKKAPIMIANDVVANVCAEGMFSEITAVMPGFINIKLSPSFLAAYVNKMAEDEKLGVETANPPKKIVMDYGGPNVAKPLHIGHLRSAIIGESIKNIYRFLGNEVIGDVHLGDWGLQMGLIIEELKDRKPELPYFDESYEGEYPADAPFTLSELEEIYPTASARSKAKDEAGEPTEDAKAFSERAHNATFALQNGHKGYQALWKHILNVSIPDLKKNYKNLNVDFDIWKGESDAKPFIDDMIKQMKEDNLAYESQGALIMDVKEETDTKEVPPVLLMKSDGAALYHTTDLATLIDREATYKPDEVLYVVDKRQEMHFTQVFRAARKSGIVRPETELKFLGFGTMNGKDGKPFKTRAGGVMRLENLIADTNKEVYDKMADRDMDEEEMKAVSSMVGLAAIKYGDLSNQPTKDYIFDLERFTSFEGNTGPYLLYTMVRIKSILAKCSESEKDGKIDVSNYELGAEERNLLLQITGFNDMIEHAAKELAPNKVCQFIYELSNAFNSFYHGNRILTETDESKKKSWIALIKLTLRILETGTGLLGFNAPDRM